LEEVKEKRLKSVRKERIGNLIKEKLKPLARKNKWERGVPAKRHKKN